MDKIKNINNKNNFFGIIRGGLSDSLVTSDKVFVSAYVTDTRLMGVFTVYIKWLLPDNFNLRQLHQFFYFDAEDKILDTYESLLSRDDILPPVNLTLLESRIADGLGGKKITISEREARYIVQQYVDMTKKSNEPLPPDSYEFDFVLSPKIELTPDEKQSLLYKQCCPINSTYQVMNYFLMRIFSKDFEGAGILTKTDFNMDLFPEFKPATLLKNSIDEAISKNSGSNTEYHSVGENSDFQSFRTRKTYLCDSLIEFDDKYYIVVTQITLEGLRVVDCQRISYFRITSTEAAMQTTRTEYISLFTFENDYDDFKKDIENFFKNSVYHEHENGDLYMSFYPDNEHVSKKVFRLCEDVYGMCYICESHQVLLCTYSEDAINKIKSDFLSSECSTSTYFVCDYEFMTPILYDFINSGIPDFESFIALAFLSPDDFDE